MRKKSVHVPSPQPSPTGRGRKNEPSASRYSRFRPLASPLPEGEGTKSSVIWRKYRAGYQFAGLLELARDLRRQETPAEGLLWQLLRNRRLRGFKFRRQHQFGDYIADVYCHQLRLVIECDGSVHEANEQWHHDQNRDAYLIAQGLRVLRFTNEQVLNRTDEVIEEISNCLPSPTGRRAGEEGL